MNLQRETAIVTGGGLDIGRTQEGTNFAINYFASSAGADSAVEAIRAEGGKAFAVQGDQSSQAGVDAMVNQTVAEFGGTDILVSNTDA